MIFGVCGGIAERWDLDPTLVRLAAVALFFFGPGLLAYLILAIVVPRNPMLSAGESYRVLHAEPVGREVARDRSREPMRYGY